MKIQAVVWCCLVLLAGRPAAEVVDSTFRPASPAVPRGTDGPILAMAQSSDGSILIAGDFLRVNGLRRNGIARLRADGTPDPGFDAGAGPDGLIRSLLIQPDGSIVVAGDFSSWGGAAAGAHLVRLKSEGALDGSFNAGPAWSGDVQSLVALENGQLLILGREYDNLGAARPVLQRREATGGLDASFTPTIAPGTALNALAKAPDGGVLAVGRFNELDGRSVTNVARLRSDGSIDADFHPVAAAGAGELLCAAVDTDGRIALGGVVTNIYPVIFLAMLLPDGQEDPGFVKPYLFGDRVNRMSFDSAHNLLTVQPYPGGVSAGATRISPAGTLKDLSFDPIPNAASPLGLQDGRVLWALQGVLDGPGQPRSWMAATLTDDSLDPKFNPGPDRDALLPWPVTRLALLPDGDLVVPGTAEFRTNTTTGQAAYERDLVRLDPQGDVRPGFTAEVHSTDGNAPAIVPADDGHLFVAGSFSTVNWDTNSPMIALLNGDGSRDASFTSLLQAPPDFGSVSQGGFLYDFYRRPDGRLVAAGNFSFVCSVPGFFRTDPSTQVSKPSGLHLGLLRARGSARSFRSMTTDCCCGGMSPVPAYASSLFTRQEEPRMPGLP
jgi:uncharacterized delta-60 repeat protein